MIIGDGVTPPTGQALRGRACDDKLRAIEKLGASPVINSKNVDVVRVIMRETGGVGANDVVVTTGGGSAVESALRLLRPAVGLSF